jgi:FAD/FMN-containing dehydrogenase
MTPIRDPAVIAGYLTDASNVTGWAEALVRPRSTTEVAEVVRHCQARGIPLLVSAGRTSITAGASPEGGWILSTEHLDHILELGDTESTAESGVVLGVFRRAVAQRGRMYPPDPTSADACTLGGSIACNASGAWSFRYGPTRRWIAALEVVLPTGEICEVSASDAVPADWPVPRWSPPPVKSAAGYVPPASLLDLFVGSEGTLGIVTRATVHTVPAPGAAIGFLAWFPDRPSAVRFVKTARSAARADPHGALSPRCLEYLDRTCLDLASHAGPVPHTARAALFCEQEVEPQHGETGHLEAWLAALAEAGALVGDTVVATDDRSREVLLALRHAVPVGINETVVRNRMPKVGTDLAVPDDALETMMDLYESVPLPSALFGHIGDNHLHLNLFPRTEAELVDARAHHERLARRAVALGGTVSAEHGIGKFKRAYLALQVGDAVLDQFRSLKRHLDPNWILGRGNVITPAERPVGVGGL